MLPKKVNPEPQHEAERAPPNASLDLGDILFGAEFFNMSEARARDRIYKYMSGQIHPGRMDQVHVEPHRQSAQPLPDPDPQEPGLPAQHEIDYNRDDEVDVAMEPHRVTSAELWRPFDLDALSQDKETGVWGMDYKESRSIRLGHFIPPTQQQELPRTPRDGRLLVLRLRKAFLSTKWARDNRTTAWNMMWLPGGRNNWDERCVDAMCWEIVRRMVELHKHGLRDPMFDRDLPNNFDMDLGFDERFKAMIRLLRCWKSICETLMKGEKIMQFICGPDAYWNRCFTNLRNNNTRKATYGAGRKALAELTNIQAAAGTDTRNDPSH